MNKARIIFMGTPTFAVATLDALVQAGHSVVAVVTAPDKPAGRGRKPRSSAVKERALALGIPVLQPERLKDPTFLEQLDGFQATIYVVVAFRMLPEVVWAKPSLGTINLHASLLPEYRGAAPINWAVINGEQRTGLTTFLIQHAIDTGDILLQEEVSIGADETAGELHDRMMMIGATLMVRTVDGLIEGSIVPRQQRANGPVHAAPKIDTQTCRLDMNATARAVHDLVRGMSPYPGAWCQWIGPDGGRSHFKILRTNPSNDETDPGTPGTVRIADGRLLLACSDRWIEVLEVQMEGKKRMSSADLIRGLRSIEGIRLE